MCNGKRLAGLVVALGLLAGRADAANLYAKVAGGNWTAAGTWSSVSAAGADNSGPPIATTDAIFELLSGNVTVDTGAVARSVNMTSGTGSYTGTLTHTLGVNLTLGDGTAGAGNVALKFSSGMTYTVGSTTSQITFASTSSTQQTITSAGKGFGQLTFNGAAGSWLFADAITILNSTMALTAGTLNLGGQALTAGTVSAASGTTLTCGTATISLIRTAAGTAWTVSAGTTLSCATATIALTVASANSRTFAGAGKSYGTLTYTVAGSSGQLVISGANTFGTINFSDVTTARSLTLTISTTNTITTAFNMNGEPGHLMTLNSSTGNTAATLSKASGIVTCDYCSIQDSTATGGATFNATRSTSVSGNTGWNFIAAHSNLTLLGVGD